MEKQNIILTKLDLNPHFARGGQGKNKRRQSETTYLNRTVAYLLAAFSEEAHFAFWGLVWAQMCQHV